MTYGGYAIPDRTTILGDRYKLVISQKKKEGISYEIKERKIHKIHPILILFVGLDLLGAVFYLDVVPAETVEAFKVGLGPIYELGLIVAFFLYWAILLDFFYCMRPWHGLEHKLVHAAENDNLDHAGEYSTVHDRCGGTYVLSLLSVYAVLSSVYAVMGWPSVGILSLMGLVMLLESRYWHKKNAPGIWFGRVLQRFATTKEPTPAMLTVGIEGMKELVRKENGK